VDIFKNKAQIDSHYNYFAFVLAENIR